MYTCVPIYTTICVSKSITCKPKIYCCSYSPYEFSDEVNKTINWSQHPLQYPINKDRSIFISLPPLTLGKVYVQWAIACRRWWHKSFTVSSEITGGRVVLGAFHIGSSCTRRS